MMTLSMMIFSTTGVNALTAWPDDREPERDRHVALVGHEERPQAPDPTALLGRRGLGRGAVEWVDPSLHLSAGRGAVIVRPSASRPRSTTVCSVGRHLRHDLLEPLGDVVLGVHEAQPGPRRSPRGRRPGDRRRPRRGRPSRGPRVRRAGRSARAATPRPSRRCGSPARATTRSATAPGTAAGSCRRAPVRPSGRRRRARGPRRGRSDRSRPISLGYRTNPARLGVIRLSVRPPVRGDRPPRRRGSG